MKKGIKIFICFFFSSRRRHTRYIGDWFRRVLFRSTVQGLFETHLTVADLDRSMTFYRDVVGLPVALQLPDRGAVFHWIGRPGRAMLGLWSIGSAPVDRKGVV